MSFADGVRKFFATHPAVPPNAPTTDARAVRDFVGSFGGPSTPPSPLTGNLPTGPRYFDYTYGANANVVPRTEFPQIPNFEQLWISYLISPLMRSCVTFRTQQILSLSWNLKQREGSGFYTGKNGATSPGSEELRRLFDRPDPQSGYCFEQWLRSCLLEIFVTDALTIYPVRSKTKRVVSFMQIDGQTIKPLIDYARGGIPAPPTAAFVQYIKGTSFATFDSETLIYRPFRPRPWCTYGESRVENVLTVAALYQLYENWAGDYFTRGNIPESVYLTDQDKTDTWDAQKLKEWQQTLDEISGVNESRRRITIAPPFVKDAKVLKQFTFEKTLPDWLVRMICIEFGVPSYLFVSETNRSTAKEMNEALYDTPLRQDLMSVKRLMDELAAVAGFEEYEFNWTKEQDYSAEGVAGILGLTAASPVDGKRVMEIPEARDLLGLGAMEGEESVVGNPDEGQDGGGSSDPGDATATDTPPADADTDQQQTAAPAAKNVVSIKSIRTAPRFGKSHSKRFAGKNAAERASLAMGFAPIIAKRMRQRQAAETKLAVERARARGLKVKGA